MGLTVGLPGEQRNALERGTARNVEQAGDRTPAIGRRPVVTQPTPLNPNSGLAAAAAAGIKLTSPDRVVYPGQGVTKADLVAYYAAVAERMLPYVENRPLSLLRCPQGRSKFCFFQKHDTGGFPDAMASSPITEKDGSTDNYFYVTDLAGLIAGTQMNVLEWHLWGARFDDIEKPERVVFDIDPDEGMDFAHVRTAALDIRTELSAWALESYALVTGHAVKRAKLPDPWKYYASTTQSITKAMWSAVASPAS